ncbi:hypothetical protein DYBT9623_00263 [Dyadobacter sp. CECT 9623]|uniref:HPt domain-containing protein n=1 Tax=Dyadobacter linearis TaxID=2823330 RepID=A0ABM8UJ63_9BACT|nr:Hpt domain-containing protein [Dyadobacter sp. CECT 9623]CAG5067542.1 hypothetical protein DYBT9623_00263 [Dyadobacter sp. CECT 9623]
MIDLALLRNLMSGDEKLVLHFVSIFKSQVPGQVESLPALCADQDWEALSTALHSLKTQFNYVGLTEFAGQMAEMEESVDSGETDTIASQIAAFQQKFDIFWHAEFSGESNSLS